MKFYISHLGWHASAGGGVWAVYPVVFSVSFTWGIVHSILTIILAATTVSTFILAAFRCAGTPPIILWGSYPVVGKGGLDNYTFCHYCSKPKSPRAHHCRSCGTCILDMDHHCPFVSIKHIFCVEIVYCATVKLFYKVCWWLDARCLVNKVLWSIRMYYLQFGLIILACCVILGTIASVPHCFERLKLFLFMLFIGNM